MDQGTKCLLQECNSGCKMAVDSMNQLLAHVKGSSLRELLEKYRKKHEELEAKSEEMLQAEDETGKEPGLAAEVFSQMTTGIKMAMDEADSKVAEILMNGCNMGIQAICRVQNHHKEASKESITLAENLVRTEEELMKELKGYL